MLCSSEGTPLSLREQFSRESTTDPAASQLPPGAVRGVMGAPACCELASGRCQQGPGVPGGNSCKVQHLMNSTLLLSIYLHVIIVVSN